MSSKSPAGQPQPTAKEMEAFDKLESVGGAARGAVAKAKPDIGQLCKEYHQVKPFIDIALGFIGKIPGWGKKVANGIRFLEQIADMACPID